MAYVKFHEKNIALLATKEVTEGTYVAPVGTDAVAATAIDGGITRETNAITFIGDSLFREETTYLKDEYGDINLDTPQQVLGALSGSLAADAAPFSELYQACGGAVSVFTAAVGSYPAGTVIVDNNSTSNSTISIDIRKSSPDDAANDKLVKMLGCRGMMDLTANIGEVPSLKFNFKGAFTDPATVTRVIPDFVNQTSQLAAAIRKETIVSALAAPMTGTFTATTGGTLSLAGTIGKKLATLSASTALAPALTGSVAGDIRFITVAGASDAAYNGTFLATIIGTGTGAVLHYQTKVAIASAAPTGTITLTVGPIAKTFSYGNCSASNFFGFDLTRYLTGAEEGFAKGAIPTDVTVTMLEDKAGTTNFDPEANIEQFFGVKIKFGTTAGKYISYVWDRLELTNTKDTKIGTYFGKDVSMRNTGKSYIIFE
jgi:hypothetical protein